VEIRQDNRGAVVLLTPVGRLDNDSSTDLELALADLAAAGARHYVVDLTQIGYVSSAGLRVLTMAAKKAEGERGSLRLAGLNPTVRQTFDLAGFSKLFQIYPDAEAALAKHPNANEAPASPALGNLAAKLMGAGSDAKGASASGGKVAKAAANLLGAKPAAAKPGTKMPKAGPSDSTMMLKSISLPGGSGVAPAPAAPVKAKKPGFFARLFGRKG
jgi:anti-sigma B factor antagonist